MRFSEERLRHLSHLIIDSLARQGLVEVSSPEGLIRTLQKKLFDYFHTDDAIDEKVRAKIASLKRQVQEGSSEWDILYRKYTEEESNRHR